MSEEDYKSKYETAAKIIGALVGLGVLNVFLIGFMIGFFGGTATTQTELLSSIAAAIFVAPFNYAIFERILNWA